MARYLLFGAFIGAMLCIGDPALIVQGGDGVKSQRVSLQEQGYSAGSIPRSLDWLARHQRRDGSWSFDHSGGPSKANPGSLTSAENGATGLVLLAYLGANQTHQEGAYQKQVLAALDYLTRRMELTGGDRGDLTDGAGVYSHSICTLVLCEAYAMTGDKALEKPAQLAINQIVHAQDRAGGWRHSARYRSDTLRTGWHLMALKSGHLGDLHVPPATVRKAAEFLDSVQSDGGSGYGYTLPGDSDSSTAGLLGRMYLGWNNDHQAIRPGVARLSKLGPLKTDLQYTFFGTQFMLHYRGDEWRNWNIFIRDHLVSTQSHEGAESGSWYSPDDHGSEYGGRLYCTAMSTMILEVYYRHLPIYGRAATEKDFPK